MPQMTDTSSHLQRTAVSRSAASSSSAVSRTVQTMSRMLKSSLSRDTEYKVSRQKHPVSLFETNPLTQAMRGRLRAEWEGVARHTLPSLWLSLIITGGWRPISPSVMRNTGSRRIPALLISSTGASNQRTLSSFKSFQLIMFPTTIRKIKWQNLISRDLNIHSRLRAVTERPSLNPQRGFRLS